MDNVYFCIAMITYVLMAWTHNVVQQPNQENCIGVADQLLMAQTCNQRGSAVKYQWLNQKT